MPSDDLHQQRTREKFEALGQYVQEFEMMVEWIRCGIYSLLIRDNGPVGARQQTLLVVAFHHRAMTAQPLFEIFRGIAATIVEDDFYKVPPAEKEVVLAILKYLGSKISNACAMRNALVHGTWFIGARGSAEDDLDALHAGKLQVTAQGIRSNENFPKRLSDLRELASECTRLGALVRDLSLCMALPIKGMRGTIFGGVAVSENFEKVGVDWVSKFGK